MYRIDWNLNIFMSSSLSPSKCYIVTLDYQTDQKYDKITKWEVGKGICWSQFVINISSRHAIFNILKFWNFPKNPSQCNVQYHSGLNDPGEVDRLCGGLSPSWQSPSWQCWIPAWWTACRPFSPWPTFSSALLLLAWAETAPGPSPSSLPRSEWHCAFTAAIPSFLLM